MNDESKNALYKNLCNTYGVEHQLDKVQEELAELIQAVSRGKAQNKRYGIVYGDVYENIVEEIADVIIMIEQLIKIYGITAEEVEKIRNEKLARTLERLNIDIADKGDLKNEDRTI